MMFLHFRRNRKDHGLKKKIIIKHTHLHNLRKMFTIFYNYSVFYYYYYYYFLFFFVGYCFVLFLFLFGVFFNIMLILYC